MGLAKTLGIVATVVSIAGGSYGLWSKYHKDAHDEAYEVLDKLEARLVGSRAYADLWVDMSDARATDRSHLENATRLHNQATVECADGDYGDCKGTARGGMSRLGLLDPDGSRHTAADEFRSARDGLAGLRSDIPRAERAATGNVTADGQTDRAHLVAAKQAQAQAILAFNATDYAQANVHIAEANTQLQFILPDAGTNGSPGLGLPAGLAALAAAALAPRRRQA